MCIRDRRERERERRRDRRQRERDSKNDSRANEQNMEVGLTDLHASFAPVDVQARRGALPAFERLQTSVPAPIAKHQHQQIPC
eukprot:999546-Rhodomonas_salina.4